MEIFLEKLGSADWPILLGMAAMLWVFNKSLQTQLASMEKRIDDKFFSAERRLERIEGKVSYIDKRLVAVETLLHMKECCVLKHDKQLKKAE